MGHLTAIQRSTTLEAAVAARSEEQSSESQANHLNPAQRAAMDRRLAQLNNALGEPDFNVSATPAVASNASEFSPPGQGSAPSRAKIAAIALLLGGGIAWAVTQFTHAPSLPLTDIQQLATAPRGAMPAPTSTPAAVAATPAEASPSTTAPQTAEPAAPAPVVPAIAPETAIRTTLEAWRLAWSGRDVAAYLSLYSNDFVPADGSRRSDWVVARTKKLASGAPITLMLNGIAIELRNNGHYQVSFLQDYAAGNYSESARPKTLEFAEENGNWKIVAERQEAAKPAGR